MILKSSEAFYMHARNPYRGTLAFFFLVAFLFSLLDISKVFFLPHCFAFDVNDDANHTFVNLEQWRRILAQGEWPMMNVYNNFGTPLLGDVITYPLSPLAITHALVPGPVAMTINRGLMGLLSLFLLFIFYHRRFSQRMSIGLGLCTFYSAGFLWHSAHHHFQMSLALLTAIFILQEVFTRRMSAGIYFEICALSIVLFLSVSLNVVLIMGFWIAGYQVYLSGGWKKKSLWFVLSGFLCGVIAAFPDILCFLEATTRSIRCLAQYPVISFDGPNNIFLTPVVAACIYSFILFREKSRREAGLVWWLGVVPYGIVLLARVFPALWNKLPLLGATDIVRLTWGASIFLMIAAGGLLLRWRQLAPGWKWQIFACLLFVGLDAHALPFRLEWMGLRFILTVICALIGISFGCWVLMGAPQDALKDAKIARLMAGFTGGAVLVFYLYYGFWDVLGFAFPQICHVTGRASFSIDGTEKYLLPQAALVIPKNSRVAYDFNTISGFDLRGASEGLFGAGARSTIMTNRDFAKSLISRGLIKFDNYTGDYHFSGPWKAEYLQELGISYVVELKNDEILRSQGWKQIKVDRGVYSYQNPLPAGVVFFKKDKDISPVPFAVKGNGLDIHFPLHRQGPQELVISLLHIPGWRAWVDGREVKLFENENKFLMLTVSSGDHFVRLRYAPFSPWVIFLCVFLALVFPAIIYRFLAGGIE